MDSFDKYVGQTFDRRYKIVKIIGVGGMAVVFEAVDLVMKQTVAVKMLKDEIANDTQAVKRFISESKAVSMLSHPNIVSIYDVSIKENLKYIVMERVDGITLKSYMNRRGALPFREVVSFTEQILRALEHAHSKNIIHRDIKPQNIMLLRDGRIKVTDFGIAKLPNAETVTMTDKAIGTVFYISPEQASGKKIDQRSDLYSLGVVMYEMATGRLPFIADSPVSVALMQVNATPRRPRELNPAIPVGLEQIILGAMEKDPDRRMRTASQMLRHLAQLKQNPDYVFRVRRSDGSITTTATAVGPRAGNSKSRESKRPRRESRSMLPVIAGVTAAFLIVIGIGAVYAINLLFVNNNKPVAVTISVQKYVDRLYDSTLKSELAGLDYYRINIVPVFDAGRAQGTIISQEPSAGEKRKVIAGQQYCTLTLTVSQGAETVSLPDYTVMEYRAVKEALKQSSLIPIETREYNDTIPMDYVIRTEPAAGTILNTGDSVTIVISRGQLVEYVTVPDFFGMTEEKAMQTLTANSLALGSVKYEYSDKAERGRVIWQSKAAAAEVAANVTEIDFTVSLGAEDDGNG